MLCPKCNEDYRLTTYNLGATTCPKCEEPRFAFRTCDGLLAVDSCPDVECDAAYIMRWVEPPYPRYKKPWTIYDTAKPGELRRYDRTPETYLGLPLFVESAE